MVISEEPKEKLELDNRLIEQIMIFHYLEVTSSQNTIKEVVTQANKAARVSGYCNGTI